MERWRDFRSREWEKRWEVCISKSLVLPFLNSLDGWSKGMRRELTFEEIWNTQRKNPQMERCTVSVTTKDTYANVSDKVTSGWSTRLTTEQVPASHPRDLVATPNPPTPSLPHFQPRSRAQMLYLPPCPTLSGCRVEWQYPYPRERIIAAHHPNIWACLSLYPSPGTHTTQCCSCIRVFVYWAFSMCQVLWLALRIQWQMNQIVSVLKLIIKWEVSLWTDT